MFGVVWGGEWVFSVFGMVSGRVRVFRMASGCLGW